MTFPLPQATRQWKEKLQAGFRAFAGDKTALACLTLVGGYVFFAVFAPIIAPQDPQDLAQIELIDARLPPLSLGASSFFILGSDALGRDIFSMTLYGLRISLTVALISATGALVFGAAAGLTAAYLGGWVNAVIMRVVDIFLSLPAILIALLFIAVFGRGVENTIIAILAVQWTHYARAMNAAAAGEINKDYVLAAKLLGLSKPRIMFGHILPNCLAPIFVIFAVQLGYVIAIEASLSFLGLGLPVTQPSLGSLVADGQEFLLSGAYWMSLIPGFVLLLLVFAMNVVGDRIRVLQNPQLQRR
ncbi:MAG: ABC transporter permease [Pseudomonadota bacterium]